MRPGFLTKLEIYHPLLRDQTPKAVAVFLIAFRLYCEGFVKNWDGSEWSRVFGCYKEPSEELAARLMKEGFTADQLRKMSRDDYILRHAMAGPDHGFGKRVATAEDFDAALRVIDEVVEKEEHGDGPRKDRDLLGHFLALDEAFRQGGLYDYDSDTPILAA